jgi:hypothetical protein
LENHKSKFYIGISGITLIKMHQTNAAATQQNAYSMQNFSLIPSDPQGQANFLQGMYGAQQTYEQDRIAQYKASSGWSTKRYKNNTEIYYKKSNEDPELIFNAQHNNSQFLDGNEKFDPSNIEIWRSHDQSWVDKIFGSGYDPFHDMSKVDMGKWNSLTQEEQDEIMKGDIQLRYKGADGTILKQYAGEHTRKYIEANTPYSGVGKWINLGMLGIVGVLQPELVPMMIAGAAAGGGIGAIAGETSVDEVFGNAMLGANVGMIGGGIGMQGSKLIGSVMESGVVEGLGSNVSRTTAFGGGVVGGTYKGIESAVKGDNLKWTLANISQGAAMGEMVGGGFGGVGKKAYGSFKESIGDTIAGGIEGPVATTEQTPSFWEKQVAEAQKPLNPLPALKKGAKGYWKIYKKNPILVGAATGAGLQGAFSAATGHNERQIFTDALRGGIIGAAPGTAYRVYKSPAFRNYLAGKTKDISKQWLAQANKNPIMVGALTGGSIGAGAQWLTGGGTRDMLVSGAMGAAYGGAAGGAYRAIKGIGTVATEAAGAVNEGFQAQQEAMAAAEEEMQGGQIMSREERQAMYKNEWEIEAARREKVDANWENMSYWQQFKEIARRGGRKAGQAYQGHRAAVSRPITLG